MNFQKGKLMKTAVTQLLECEYPVLLSGMTGVSTPELAGAVSNAGGLGLLATADLTLEQTRQAVRRTRRITDRPFGANVPLLIPGAEEKMAVLVEEKVPVVNYTLGSGEQVADVVHRYGGKVVATVTTAKHALSAEKHGADALIVTGHEAAAHGGAVASMVLIPGIVDRVNIPVIAAGGIADGRGLAAALVLGAEGVAMGTRFMNTRESPVHDTMKQLCNQKAVEDTVYSDRIDGLPCRALDSSGARKMMADRLYLFKALANSRFAARAYGFPWIAAMAGILLSGYRRSKQLARMANAFRAVKLAIDDGDQKRGVFLMGQVTGLIDETLTVGQVMEKILIEAASARARLAAGMGQE
ncbi:2-nitropropane dioxygenase NPD [Desulfosudis oleivorans Hxd3]|uniref:2-nitropropane dioxygenase NPD n=2 Tax=Desulfosudis TaxID=2904716 RepID=A8ZZT0_DESOH|nr:2-nitropropane dioxygenase NPD [Desulfosudis oleivorans Hxd3]